MSHKAPRGTHDTIGIDAARMNLLGQRARVIFKKHGFEEVKTPIFEDAFLFMRSVGEMTDIVEKEMYVFEDKNGRKLALRPEGTASLVRAFIEDRLDILNPTGKFFYEGEMFRYERPQAGRYRQFHQIGAEFFGVSSPTADAEIILLACDLLSSVGINKVDVRLNSLGCQKCRHILREKLVEYMNSVSNLCEDCFRRLEKNPLRVLDCKIDANKFTGIPQLNNCLCDDCKHDFDLLKSLLDDAKCNYTIDNKLVRGLDYYTKTVFEICCTDTYYLVTSDVKEDSYVSKGHVVIAAGGRYDNLVKELGGSYTPAVGFAIGSERVLAIAKHNFQLVNTLKNFMKKFLIIIERDSTLNENSIDGFNYLLKKALDDENPMLRKILEDVLVSVSLNQEKINNSIGSLEKEVLIAAQNSTLLNKYEVNDLFVEKVLSDLCMRDMSEIVGRSTKSLDETCEQKFKELLLNIINTIYCIFKFKLLKKNWQKLEELWLIDYINKLELKVLMAAQSSALFNGFQESEKIYVAIANQELLKEAFSIAARIMRNGLKDNKDVAVFGPVGGRRLAWQLKFADKIGADRTIIFAKTEFEENRVIIVKDMKTKTQTEISIDEI